MGVDKHGEKVPITVGVPCTSFTGAPHATIPNHTREAVNIATETLPKAKMRKRMRSREVVGIAAKAETM